MARFIGAALVAAILAAHVSADAEEGKQSCMTAYVDVQSRRQESKLLAARVAAVVCGNEACPALLRADCVRWVRELDASIPTVVFSVSTAEGHDVVDARVLVDGTEVAQRSLGKAIALDPGEHVAICEVRASTPVEAHIVVAQGERNRPVHFRIEPPAFAAASGIRPAPVTMRPTPPLVFALGAVGVVSLGVWGYFGASAFWGDPSVRGCKSGCSAGDHAAIYRKFNVADVAGGLALVSFGAGAGLYFTRPTITLMPTRSSAIAVWTQRF